ncbi:MAG TPA: translocation/assembly module TamB domain-containing protein [Fulvivirga sp.]|nr:translocation/assembly module TamB domain-containing protein [Fulvivirga sp.]
MAQVIKNRIVKTILWFTFSLFLLLVITAGAVQFPYVQTKLVNYISTKYSQLLGYDISLAKISIRWFDSIEINGLNVKDPEDNQMFFAGSVFIDFDVSSLLNKKDHNVDNIVIDHADLLLTKLYADDDSLQTLNINELIHRIKSLLPSKKQARLRYLLTADNLSITNTRFSYVDQRKDSLDKLFDYYHFSIDSINGDFDEIFTVRDTFSVNIKSLVGIDQSSGLRLNKLVTRFSVSQRAMEFDSLELHAGSSIINNFVRFEYLSTLDLSDFNDKVNIIAHLENSKVNTKDLSLFAPVLSDLNENYQVSGDMKGTVKSFQVRNAHIFFGSGTSLKGNLRMDGLPNVQETFMSLNLTSSYVTIADFKKYTKPSTYQKIEPFEHVSLSAEFLGFPNDFVAKGNFFTEYGKVSSDINLKIHDDISQSTYSGSISMQNFDIGGYTKSNLLSNVTVKGKIKGSGFTLENADFTLDGEIKKIGVNGYGYQNISTNARFTKEFFEGDLSVNDPNLKLTVNGSIDLRAGLNFFNIKAKLDTANLKTLNITQNDLFLHSTIDVNARGLKIDDILGGANLKNTYIKYGENSIQIDSLLLISDKDEDQRIVLLNSNLLNVKILGDFQLTQAYKSLIEVIREYRLSLQNDQEVLAHYYAFKSERAYKDYSLKYDINIKNLNPLLDVFTPGLYISPASKVSGSLTGGYTTILEVDTKLDSVSYKNNIFLNNEIQLNISKISDSTNVLAMVYLASKDQYLNDIGTKDLMFEGIWDNHHIDFEFDLFQKDFENRALISGAIDFLPDTTKLKLESTDLKILDKQWHIQTNNVITISKKEINVDNFSIYNQDQKIALKGAISENPETKMELQLTNIELGNANSLINKNLSGTIDGYADVRDVYNDILIENYITVKKLTIDDFLIGNVKASSSWSNAKKASTVNCDIQRLGFKVLTLTGTYEPYQTNQLNLEADLNNTELKILEPFIDNYFTDIKGTLLGKLNITGELTKPLINGKGDIKNAGLHVNYLNTTYALDGNFYLTDHKIGFQNIDVIDTRGNHGSVNGYIGHDYFKNMSINLTANINEFQVLNTTSKDNRLFYGNGIATGTVNFIGPFSNMNIIANARTDRGTRIFIPIGDSESIAKEDYINFVDFDTHEQTLLKNESHKIDLRGLKLDFDLDITPDAYCEIIFDIKSGDIIRGRGNGDIKLQIDTKGDFNMFGDYNIQEGGYNFTLYNLINKEFEILPDSKISWFGDPYQGVLDINATYNQLASYKPLLSIEQYGEDNLNQSVEINRKYQANVLLEIDGALLSPTINFDITSGSLPRNIQLASGDVVDLEFEFLKFKNSIDEQELKRQVFSLIILRKFSPLLSFDTGGSINSSVSELLSNQLSYWITQVDDNLEIDVDFGKLDEDAFNTFQLRLSYTLLNGRLRITRDGGFTNQSNKADVSSIAGDWTLEYLLTDDGKFKVKMYNRTNYNPINPTEENQNTVTTGVSIIHTQSFDEIKDLFKKKRDKIQTKQKNDQQSQDEDASSKNNEAIREDEME